MGYGNVDPPIVHVNCRCFVPAADATAGVPTLDGAKLNEKLHFYLHQLNVGVKLCLPFHCCCHWKDLRRWEEGVGRGEQQSAQCFVSSSS